jgi:hypothetical protein
MLIALGRLAEEDPTFGVLTNEETGETEISGLEERHLEILVDRMRREFNVSADVGPLQVCYRETIRGTAENVEGRNTLEIRVAEMFGYAADLKSNTQDQATDTVQFDRYEEPPWRFLKRCCATSNWGKHIGRITARHSRSRRRVRRRIAVVRYAPGMRYAARIHDGTASGTNQGVRHPLNPGLKCGSLSGRSRGSKKADLRMAGAVSMTHLDCDAGCALRLQPAATLSSWTSR